MPVLRHRGGSGPQMEDAADTDDRDASPKNPTDTTAGTAGCSHGHEHVPAATACVTPAAAANDNDASETTFVQCEDEMTQMYGGGSLTDPDTYQR